MAGTIDALKELLESVEADLIRYSLHKDSGDPVLAANYMHKKRQRDQIEAQIAALEKEKDT